MPVDKPLHFDDLLVLRAEENSERPHPYQSLEKADITPLLTPETLKRIAANPMLYLTRAMENNNPVVVDILLENESVIDQIAINNNEALIFALEKAKHSHDKYIAYARKLLKFKAVRQEIMRDGRRVLIAVARMQNEALLNSIIRLMSTADIAASAPQALLVAMENSQLTLSKRLLAIDSVKEKIKECTDARFILAAIKCKDDIIFDEIYKLTSPSVIQTNAREIVVADISRGGRGSKIYAGKLKLRNLEQAIKETNGDAFRAAVEFNNKPELLMQIAALTPPLHYAASNNAALIAGAERYQSDSLFSQTMMDLLLNNQHVRAAASAQGNQALINLISKHRRDLERNYAAKRRAVIHKLLQCPGVKESITAQENQPFITLMLTGDPELVDEFLAMPEVVAMITAQNNKAIENAAYAGRLDLVERLFEYDAVKDAFGPSVQYYANLDARGRLLINAVKSGNAELVQYLISSLKQLVNDQESFSQADLSIALAIACKKGYVKIVGLLLPLMTPEAIAANENQALINATCCPTDIRLQPKPAQQGATAPGFSSLLSSVSLSYSTGYGSYLKGSAAIVDMLLESPKVREKIAAQENQAFINAVKNDNSELRVILGVFQAVKDNFAAQENVVLIKAIVDRDWTFVEELLRNRVITDNIAAQGNQALIEAIYAKNWELVDRLMTFEAVRLKIAAQNNGALCAAISVRADRLINDFLTNQLVLSAIATGNNRVYEVALMRSNDELCNRLLNFVEVFAQAEQDVDSYNYTHVINFRNDWLRRFANQAIALNDEREQRFAYLMLRNLVRNPHTQTFISKWSRRIQRFVGFNVDLEYDDFIDKLLSLPHIQQILLSSTPESDCEILDVAFDAENIPVLEKLLQNPSIRAIAAERVEQINIILDKPRTTIEWILRTIQGLFGYTPHVRYFKPEAALAEQPIHAIRTTQDQAAQSQSYLDCVKAVMFSPCSWRKSAANTNVVDSNMQNQDLRAATNSQPQVHAHKYTVT